MVLPELDTKRAKRLRLACLLVQIALVEWVVQTLVLRTGELWGLHAPQRVGWWVHNLAFLSSLARWILLIVAVWILSRGLRMWRSQIGILLIFNVLLITLVRWLLAAMNWVWQLAGHDAKLVVEDPLGDYFAWIGHWVWCVIWLFMIYGGAKIARDINSRFDDRLLPSRRISVLFYTAVAVCILYAVEPYGVDFLLRSIFPDVSQASLLNFQIVVTLLRLVVVAPAIMFCVMLFTALRKVRRVLASPTLRICPKCSHALHESNVDRCPECGWTAVSEHDGEPNST